ncbi:lipopolysaccharide heptosyltransferase II [Vibrio scophthalmi]|uniref:lipopolysaccharide heptosyltransferase II n=1 Tax=Vibrio scophthalmi TaxID=45658 RepID=UPI00228381D7|nr:lipopolysaccharide heptosyltransferase II [Vibrio scophthalmi]MCY9804057.1 lipopolysaccharide heptosyltransferase II [Vibrio scophthalmi]
MNNTQSKILIIGPSWVGDMVMSQSLYIQLKNDKPNAQIDVLAPAWCKPILERMPEVHRAIEMPVGHGEFGFKERLKIARKLRSEQYQYAFVLPNSAKSALIPFLAGIPTRTGWKGEFRYGLLNDLRPNKKAFQYMIERYVALAHPKDQMNSSKDLGGINQLPWPNLSIDGDIQQTTLEKFSLNRERKILGLCPGAEFGPAKQWPVEHYAEVANEAIKKGYQVWLFGSAKDKLTTRTLSSLVDKESQPHIYDLAGKTSLIEVVDLLATCKTVVSNDSGLMHVAAAVGCHVIGVYGSTSPDYTPPLTNTVDIVSTSIECRPCFKRECPLNHFKCLKDLNPNIVTSKL